MREVVKIDPDEISIRVTNYVKALETIDEATRRDLLEYIEETLTDANLDHTSKCRAIVQKLYDSDCRQCVIGLVRRAKRLARGGSRLGLALERRRRRRTGEHGNLTG